MASVSSLSGFRTAGLVMLQLAPWLSLPAGPIIGPEISVDDLAAASKSTGREVLSHLGRRFHRIYYAI
ncbi:MAG: hypothetical protein WCD13_08735 [Pseudolabrys sp.]